MLEAEALKSGERLVPRFFFYKPSKIHTKASLILLAVTSIGSQP